MLLRKLILEGTVKGTSRAAKEMANAGTGLFEKTLGLAEKAVTAAAESTARGVRFPQRSPLFWETVASAGEDSPELDNKTPSESPSTC
jgi:hypothetical protein